MTNRSQLKDALTIHFMNIRNAGSCFGHDHAEILKDHIDRITTARLKTRDPVQEDAESPAELAILPRAISRFAPRATLNPASNWGNSHLQFLIRCMTYLLLGLLGKLPRELRDTIYEDVLFYDCSSYLHACNCTKEDRRSKSGIALLRTCGKIYNEVLPMLYGSEVFGISLGYEVSFDECKENFEWPDPVFYRQTAFGRQTIIRLPHNALSLIQNLELNFTDAATLWQTKMFRDFFSITNKLLRHISQVCANLEDSVQLQRLDINLSFSSKFSDIEHMTRLFEPIKKLRGIQDPNISVCGYQLTDYDSSTRPSNSQDEPRWCLTDEFTEYLEGLLMSSHGTPTLPSDGVEVFEDDYECSEIDEDEHWNEV